MAQRTERRHQPPGVTTGSIERPTSTLAAPVMTFDLPNEIAQLHAETNWAVAERNGKTLVHEPDFRVVLTAMHTGTRLPEHDAEARISMQTMDGHLRVRLGEEILGGP